MSIFAQIDKFLFEDGDLTPELLENEFMVKQIIPRYIGHPEYLSVFSQVLNNYQTLNAPAISYLKLAKKLVRQYNLTKKDKIFYGKNEKSPKKELKEIVQKVRRYIKPDASESEAYFIWTCILTPEERKVLKQDEGFKKRRRRKTK